MKSRWHGGCKLSQRRTELKCTCRTIPPLQAFPRLPQKAIDRADCVLAIITTAPGATVQDQLRYALKKRKLVIPIVRAELHPVPVIARPPRIFTFSPSDAPGTIETRINQFLKDQQVAKEEQQAIGALAALALGLLTLVSLNKE